MKKIIIISCIFFFFCAPVFAQSKFPTHLGGFTLGKDIGHYGEILNMETCREMIATKYLGEGEVIPPPGFKSGIIAYGRCDKPNKILRIKLKFTDPSKKFFMKLLKRYKKELGEPAEYKGDPFQVMIAWKWSFTDGKGERLSLILQHNTMVEDEKMGNAVKLTLTSQVEKERTCFLEKALPRKKAGNLSKGKNNKMWDYFIPR